MEDVKAIARKIAVDSDIDPDAKFGSVLVIIMLIGIFINVIRVIQECNKSELFSDNKTKSEFYANEMRSLSSRRSWYTKMRLKKILRQHMPIPEYKKYKNVLCENILNAAESVTQEQVNSLLEVQNV